MVNIGPLLGEGHYATVHRGTDPIHGDVAIKTPRRRKGESNAEWRDRKSAVLDEGVRLVQATHKNVVRVLYLEKRGRGAPHLVMEYCPGGSLEADYKNGPLTLRQVRDLATDVCLGLQSIHAKDMIHRDLKPANILRDANGRVKIGDFGLVTDQLVHGYAATDGYAPHMAKELWDGKGTSKRSDVWALGMTIYRLLHGERWYDLTIPPWTMVAVGGYAKRLAWLPHVPKIWRRFVAKCLHDQTNRRYQSADAVLSSLARLPVSPIWSCCVIDGGVRWNTEKGNRRLEVTWDGKPGKRKGAWEAISRPIGQGRTLRLGGSASRPWGASRRDLDGFFDRHGQ